jgi:outer membrane receptor protein involved in Fe transport
LIEQYMGERGTVDLQTGMWRELDAYWRTDLSYKLSVGGRWWLAAGAQNLLDRKYDEWVGNLAPARLWTVEIGVSCW